MRWCGQLLWIVAGCGRVDFDDRALVLDSGEVDALHACVTGSPPDPLTLTGITFQYNNYVDKVPVPGATVTALDGAGAALGATTSAPTTGAYTLTVPTGGQPVTSLKVTVPGFFTTLDYYQTPLASMTSYDLPLWDQNAMTIIYNAGGAVEDPNLPMINVGVYGCGGETITDGTVALLPAAAKLDYIDPSGSPSPTQMMTTAPYPFALALNGAVAATTVTTTAQDRTFQPLVFDAPATMHVLRVFVNPEE